MLRSLYSGISGMRVNQTKLDVLGNNVANVGTTAFKSSRARFQDMLSQNINSALAPSLNQGGVNPSKVGLGVKLAGIDSIMGQGVMQPTSRNLDMAIDGEGFFIVSKGPVAFEDNRINVNDDNTIGSTGGNDIFFTRDGSFTLDSEGNLLTSDGLRVLGYSVSGNSMPYDITGDANNDGVITAPDGDPNTVDDIDINGDGVINDKDLKMTVVNPANSAAADGVINFVDADSVDNNNKMNLKASQDLKTLRIPDSVYDEANDRYLRVISFTVEKDGLIKAVCEGGKVSVLGQIAMSSFKNPGGLEKLGSNLYRNSPNSGEAVVRTGVGAATDNGKGYGDMLQGMLEMSNVDLAEQFTEMIVTSRAFQASGKMITTGDEILQEIINLKR
jgi:flagellar hook protein FlgE